MNVINPTSNSCLICSDVFEKSTEHDAVRLDCQHAFGRSCIKKAALKSVLCPECGVGSIPAELSARPKVRTVVVSNPLSIACYVLFGLGVLNTLALVLEANSHLSRP